MGCTHSTQHSNPLPPARSVDTERFPSISSGGSTTNRPNAPLRLPRSCPSGPNTPRTRHDLDRERRAFFDTRVTGRAEIWQAIQLAIDLVRNQHDLATAQGVLDASGITAPRGRLEEGVWDEQGQLYSLPDWIVSDPCDFVDDEKEDLDADTKDGFGKDRQAIAGSSAPISVEQTYEVRCRLSDRGTDLEISLGKTEKAKALADLIMKHTELSPGTKLKLAYLGKILKDNEPLSRQGWQEGHVISVLVSAPE